MSEERSNSKNKGKANNRVDLGKRLDQSMISESNMMLENADFVCAINREYSPADGRYYLTFKDLKNRSDKGNNKPTDGYFAHPFEDGNTMRLQEDVDLDRSLSFDSIANTLGAVVDDDDFIEDDDDEDSQEEKRNRVMKSRESKKKVLRRNIDTI